MVIAWRQQRAQSVDGELRQLGQVLHGMLMNRNNRSRATTDEHDWLAIRVELDGIVTTLSEPLQSGDWLSYVECYICSIRR